MLKPGTRLTIDAMSRLAHRAIIAGTFAGLLAGAVADKAGAQDFPPIGTPAEIWVCTDATHEPGRFPLELSLRDGILSEQPLGVPRYRLLANTRYAIIGEDHHGDFDPVLGGVSIFVSTVVIDRTTGRFTSTTSVTDAAPQYRTGSCRRFEDVALAASDGVLARR
jgi:hypothetical protein